MVKWNIFSHLIMTVGGVWVIALLRISCLDSSEVANWNSALATLNFSLSWSLSIARCFMTTSDYVFSFKSLFEVSFMNQLTLLKITSWQISSTETRECNLMCIKHLLIILIVYWFLGLVICFCLSFFVSSWSVLQFYLLHVYAFHTSNCSFNTKD